MEQPEQPNTGRYSIRLKNGEREIELHHDADVILQVWTQMSGHASTLFDLPNRSNEKTTGSVAVDNDIPQRAALPVGQGPGTSPSDHRAPAPNSSSSPSRNPRAKPRAGAGRPSKAEMEEVDQVLEGTIPEEARCKSALLAHESAGERALIVLYVASRVFGVRGLTVAQIDHILTDRFEHKVSRPAISIALKRASEVSRNPAVHKDGAVYRITAPGSRQVEAVISGNSEAPGAEDDGTVG